MLDLRWYSKMRQATIIALCVVAIIATASVLRNSESSDPPIVSSTAGPSPIMPPATTPAPAAPTAPRLRATPLGPAVERLDTARTVARRTGHRFTTRATIAVDGLPSTRATLTGSLAASGSSIGTITWSGPLGLALPSGQLRIEDNELSIRSSSTARWRVVGSASGITLDVGRELLDHPFLLAPERALASPDGRAVSVTHVANAASLRTYAQAERQGLATDLLADARSLSITSDLRSGRLAADRFRLVTTLPDDAGPLLAGRIARVTAQSTYSSLQLPARRSTS